MAQSVSVTGTITDNQGPIIGAQVLVGGTHNGCITDVNGKYKIANVPEGGTLIVSFIGYKTQKIAVKGRNIINITLKENSELLDEVVVIGYQEVRKKDLTGSVSKANMNDLLSAPVATFDQAMGGRIAGVNVSSNEGMPGSQMNITIRGNNSLTQDNSPLYIIDGFPVEDSSVGSSINPSDIESIDILKDASATSIYGARGANGVVIITTKKGSIGKPKIQYNGSFGLQNVTRTIPLMNAYEFVKLQAELYPTMMESSYFEEYEGKQWSLEDYRNISQYNWQNEIFRTAWQQNHNINLTGGSEGVRYNASLSYYNQDGVILNSNYNRMQGRLNTTIHKNKLNINMSINYSHSTQTGSSPSQNSYSGMNNLFYSVWGYRPVTQPNIPLSSLKDNATDADAGTNDYRFNPIMSLKEEYRKNFINYLAFNGYAEYEFIKGLKLKVSGGYTYDARRNESFNNSKTRYGSSTSTDKVNATVSNSERLTWLNENILTYQTNIQKKHFFNAMAGITLQNSDYKYYSFKTIQIPNESLGMAGMSAGVPSTTNSLISSWAMLSYLARLNYNYQSKYYLSATFRADGSSKFRDSNRFGYFPSASAAWNFTQEKFATSIKPILSNGKLRVSWGTTGNNRVGEYDTYALLKVLKAQEGDYVSLGSIPSGVYPFNNDLTNVGAVPYSLPNKDLKWETTEQWNIGVDLGFFNDRITTTIDWYNKITRDLLLDAALPASSGYLSAMKNIGKVRNRGLEITLNTTNIQTHKFTWTTNFNISFNRNKVLELSENQLSLLTNAAFDQNYNSMPNYIAKIGYPMGMMYGYIYEGTYKYADFDKSGSSYTLKQNIPHFTSESNTQPGYPKYKDLNGDGVIDSNDQTMIGNGMPKYTGGITNDFTYKNFDLSIFFQWSYGNDILNANRLMFESSNNKGRELNQYASYINRWTSENPESNIPVASNSASNKVFSSRIIEDGSYLRLKTVTLGYSLPKKTIRKWKMSQARIYIAGQNLCTLTNYSGYDPEVSIRNSALTPGLDYSSYPRAWSIDFGFNLGF
ncbi:MAG: TonB-dependent receptor [Bacteroides sp.]|jgi:TonB-linked SusC/RagA family outer membrane protein|nr:TonB-dependent receptor [Bacteroides sp.]MCI1682265.1 TonB-dependent receptor [Bacteroides sp.]